MTYNSSIGREEREDGDSLEEDKYEPDNKHVFLKSDDKSLRRMFTWNRNSSMHLSKKFDPQSLKNEKIYKVHARMFTD